MLSSARRSQLSLIWFFVLLSVCSIIFFAFIYWNNYNDKFGPLFVGKVVGSAVIPIAAALPLAIFWRIVEKLFRVSSYGPHGVALLSFCAVLYFQYLGRDLTTSAQNTSLEGCEFSVVFPTSPNFKSLQIVNNANPIAYQQAFIATENEYLRAECLPYPIGQKDAEITLSNQAKSEGFQNSSLDLISEKIVRLRGYKILGGSQGTVEIEIHRGARSTLFMAAMAKSEIYPTVVSKKFFESVE